MTLFYGLSSSQEIYQHARAVCDVLGHGSTNQAIPMLMRTCASETGMGRVADRMPYSHGVGLYQHDEMPWKDVRKRTSDSVKDKIYQAWGIDYDELEHRELAYSPLLSTIAARVHYLIVPDAFPKDLAAQGAYWKAFYNSYAGKGTVDKFIENAHKYGVA